MFWPQHNSPTPRVALPRNITIRRGMADDEYLTFEVMRRTMGHEMAWSQHAPARHHLQHTACSSLWVAEEKQRFTSPRIVGYARSVVRDAVWSLTEFFVLPGHHRQGIGGALLARCKEDGETFGADTRMVLASQHSAADSLYVRKLACYPRLPMMMLVGGLAKLKAPECGTYAIVEAATDLVLVDPASGPAETEREVLLAEPLVLTSETAVAIDALDRRIVGFARPQEHAFWAREMGGAAGAARIFRHVPARGDGTGDPGRIIGYAYVGFHSSGPALAEEPEQLPYMLAHVSRLSVGLSHAESEAEIVQPLEQYWALAGTNEVTLKWLLDCGWQIVFHYLFMSSRPLGSFDRYVGYNPLYFL